MGLFRCVTCLALVVIAAAATAKPADEAQPAKPDLAKTAKVESWDLTLSGDSKLGLFWVRKKGSNSANDWKKLPPKKENPNAYRVPVGYDLRLDVVGKKGAPADLAPLDSAAAQLDVDLIMLNFGGKSVNDEGLAHLKRLKAIKILNLSRTEIGDAGLAHLDGLSNMETLYLDDTNVGDAGLATVHKMTRLVHLNLAYTGARSGKAPADRIHDAGLENLRGLGAIQYLNLEGAQVTDAGLDPLQSLMLPYSLNLSYTKITDAGLAKLKHMRRLRDFYLRGTAVTDEGAKTFLDHPNLEILDLTDAKITEGALETIKNVTTLKKLYMSGGAKLGDAGMAALKTMKLLQELEIGEGQATTAQLAELKAALPVLKITVKK